MRHVVTRHLPAVGLLLALLGGSSDVLAGAPRSAQTIRPLLIGSEVRELVLKTSDGSDFDLNEAFSKTPTIVIFYRGGW